MNTSKLTKHASRSLFLFFLLVTEVSAQAKPIPAAFTTNCKACHDLQTEPVGPSLVEIARLYPQDKQKTFIEWCINPGKKRADKAQMPSMAHISEKDLQDIHEYILKASEGLERVPMPKTDPYQKSKIYTKRPRILRTFIPNTGPASLIIALPTKELHNIIWDTDLGMLRYITTGEPDSYPYWKSNGNSEANPGKLYYTENESLFGSQKIQYLGYQINKEGYPTFHYTIGKNKISESYTVINGTIHRILKSNLKLPKYQLKESDSKNIKRSIQQSGNTLTIKYTPSNN